MLKAVVTDVDGTITDQRRRISTCAIECIRTLVDAGVRVVLASGNTPCFMNTLTKMIGTDGTFIGENGGVYRIGFTGDLQIHGDQQVCWDAYSLLRAHFDQQGVALELFGAKERYADLALARNVPVDEVRRLLSNSPVQVLDTGFAIHLQSLFISKATALEQLALALDLPAAQILAVGDSENDIPMLQWAGTGIAVANARPAVQAAANQVTAARYGEGFVEAVRHALPSLF